MLLSGYTRYRCIYHGNVSIVKTRRGKKLGRTIEPSRIEPSRDPSAQFSDEVRDSSMSICRGGGHAKTKLSPEFA